METTMTGYIGTTIKIHSHVRGWASTASWLLGFRKYTWSLEIRVSRFRNWDFEIELYIPQTKPQL